MSEHRLYPAGTAAPASPCVRNCCLDENDVCMGCYRSVEEIVRWSNADAIERCAILERAERRKPIPKNNG